MSMAEGTASGAASLKDRDGVIPLGLLAVAVAIGSVFGAVEAAPQFALEGATISSGLIPYDQPTIIHHIYGGAWSLLNQAGGLLLRLGLPTAALNYLYCMIPYGLLAGAFTMVIYGFTPARLGRARPWLALAGGLACLWAGPLAWPFRSPVYPLWGADGFLILWAATYGVWGAVLAVWSVAALAGGRTGIAGFSAIAAIAVHPVMGLYATGLIVASVIVGRWLGWRLNLRSLLWGAGAGLVVVLVSLAFWLAAPHVQGSEQSAAYATYLRIWDLHRNIPVDMKVVQRVILASVMLAGVLTLFLIRPGGERRERDAAALALLGSVVGGAGLYLLVQFFPEEIPQRLRDAMPGRVLNLQAYLVPPLALALAAWAFEVWRHGWTAADGSPRGGLPWVTGLLTRARWLPALAVALFYAGVGGLVLWDPRPYRPPQSYADLDYGDPFWREARAAQFDGALLAAPELAFPAVVAGRLPSLIEPTQLDLVSYVPSLAPEMATIVEKGYGIPFDDPPQPLRFRGGLDKSQFTRAYWAQLTPAQWASVGSELGVGAVLAPSDWTVALPVLVEGRTLRLYRIAPPGEPATTR